MLIGSDLARCVLILLAALAVAHRVQLWPLAVLAIGFGTVDALFMPAVGALPAVLAAAGDLARVQGMRVLAVRAANLAGPVLAGAVLGVGGASAAFVAAGALFGASLAMLATLRLPQRPIAPPAGPGMWRQFTEGGCRSGRSRCSFSRRSAYAVWATDRRSRGWAPDSSSSTNATA